MRNDQPSSFVLSPLVLRTTHRAALLSAAVRAHDAFLASSLASSPQAAEEIWDYGSQGWHPGFNPKRREEVEAVLTDPVGLPPRPATLAEVGVRGMRGSVGVGEGVVLVMHSRTQN